jgi:hypothetical protein
MTEVEVFRITPVLHKCYEHAEYTRRQGRYPDERYFTNVPPRYVGEFIRFEQGGWGDGSWRIDYFRDLYGNQVSVNYSYEGRTCFREVPCGPPPMPKEHLDKIKNRNRIPSLRSLAFFQLPTKTISELRNTYDNVVGGKSAKHKRRIRKSTRRRRSKRH